MLFRARPLHRHPRPPRLHALHRRNPLGRLGRAPVVVAVAVAVACAGLTVPSSAAWRAEPVRFPRSPQGLPAPVAQPDEVEEASGYFGQVSCNPRGMRGVRKLRALVLSTYDRGHDGGITRSCATGGSSEHKEGRAWDWMLDVGNRRERRAAGDFLAWLTARGGRQARRLGVMYVIYNRRMWASYDPGWEAYDGYSPHTDHIHLSFSWAGARGRTSFWTGRVAATDFGPCRVFVGQPAVPRRRANPTPCDSPEPLVKRSTRPSRVLGSAGRPVRAAQRALRVRVTGIFDRRTWRAVRDYQQAHDLPVTGVLDKPTWSSLAPRSVRWSATADFGPRRAARYANRHWSGVRLRRGSAGRPVAFLQTALGMRPRDCNGLLGRRTAAALREFKTSRGMARRAVVTRAVWQALAARR